MAGHDADLQCILSLMSGVIIGLAPLQGFVTAEVTPLLTPDQFFDPILIRTIGSIMF
jgi:hypothetical protein